MYAAIRRNTGTDCGTGAWAEEIKLIFLWMESRSRNVAGCHDYDSSGSKLDVQHMKIFKRRILYQFLLFYNNFNHKKS
jgi:hypothetical protein